MATIRIRNKKRSNFGILVILLVILVLVIGGAYLYFKVTAITNSEVLQAKKIDYLIYVNNDNPFYVLVRNKKDQGTVVLELPEYLVLEPLEKVLTGDSLNETKKMIDSWLGISSDEYYYWEIDKDGLREFASAFGFSANNYQELLDGLAKRGLEFFDYWKLGDYVEIIKKRDSNSNLSKAGLAAMLQRLGQGSMKYVQISTITRYPIEVKTSLSTSPVKKLYIEDKSLENLMALFVEW